MLSLYVALQIYLNNVFPREPSIWLVMLVAGLRLISPWLRHSAPVCSIFSGLLFSFPEKFFQGLTQSGWGDVHGPYFRHLQCLWNRCLWLAVFTVLRLGKDGSYGLEMSQKHQRFAFVFSILVRLIWFCQTAKLSKSVLSNFKRMTQHQQYLHSCMEANHTLRNVFSSNLYLSKWRKLSHGIYSSEPLPLLP